MLAIQKQQCTVDCTSPNSTRHQRALYTGNRNDLAIVGQQMFGYTIARDNRPIIASPGAGSCVVLGGFEFLHKIAFAIHFAVKQQTETSLRVFARHLIENVGQPEEPFVFNVHIVGGIEGSSNELVDFCRYKLNKTLVQANIPISFNVVGEDVLGYNSDANRNMAISAIDGSHLEFDPWKHHEHRLIYDKWSRKLSSDSVTSLAYRPGLLL